MKIDTYRVKQYNSTTKTVICIDGKPICIVRGCGETLSNIVSYIQGYDAKIFDGKIKKIIDKYKETYGHTTNKSNMVSESDKWHKEPPKKNGRYLIWWNGRVNIANYAEDLYKIDKYDFYNKKGCSGWYQYDSHFGYFELNDVEAWQDPPEDYVNNN